ncbi:MAG: type II secretion system F family protein [Luteimonas sp.]
MNQVMLIALCAGAAIFFGGLYAFSSGSAFLARYRESFMEQARVNMTDMFLFVDPTRLFIANAVFLIVLTLLVWIITGNLIAAVVALVLCALLPRKLYTWLKARRIDTIQNQLPDTLMMLSSSMKAGLGFTPALESVVRDGYPPLAQELALVLREQHLGVKQEDALENLTRRVPVMDMQLFISAVLISREVGGNLAESLKTVAETLRRRLIMEGKVKSLTAQGRLQGIVMAMLPVGLVGYLAWMYPDTMAPMFDTWIGYGIIAICVVLEYLGYKVCKKIMTIDI